MTTSHATLDERLLRTIRKTGGLNALELKQIHGNWAPKAIQRLERAGKIEYRNVTSGTGTRTGWFARDIETT